MQFRVRLACGSRTVFSYSSHVLAVDFPSTAPTSPLLAVICCRNLCQDNAHTENEETSRPNGDSGAMQYRYIFQEEVAHPTNRSTNHQCDPSI